jgi:hypothetical protein
MDEHGENPQAEHQDDGERQRLWDVFLAAIAKQQANAAADELDYEATKAYWVTRGLAEDRGIPPDEAKALGKRAYAAVYRRAGRIHAEVDAIVAAKTAQQEGSDR